MKKEYENQDVIRDMVGDFMVNNPMSWNAFARGAGISINTVRKFRSKEDLGQVEPLFKILKFIKDYEK